MIFKGGFQPRSFYDYMILCHHTFQDFFPSFSISLSGFVCADFGQGVMGLKHLLPASCCSACSYEHSLNFFGKMCSSKPGYFDCYFALLGLLILKDICKTYTDTTEFTYPI